MTPSAAARSSCGCNTVLALVAPVAATLTPLVRPEYATFTRLVIAYPAGAPGWTVTRNVTHVVPAMGMVPSVQPAAPAAYEPASSPVASVTGAPPTVSDPGT